MVWSFCLVGYGTDQKDGGRTTAIHRRFYKEVLRKAESVANT